eukprot:c24169_g1_i1 orf=108-782(+)
MEEQAIPDSWDGLRKLARKLEGELDAKLSSYRQLVISDGQGAEDMTEEEIKELLQQLQQVNLCVESLLSSACSDVISHSLTRQKNILREIGQEFRKLQSSAKARREHEELLESFGKVERTWSSPDNGVIDPAQKALLHEQALLQKSTTQLDTVITQADVAFGALASQRLMFSDMSSKIIALNSKFPSVHGILRAIRHKKSRDTIILSLVVSVCSFLILVYWLSK